ncbi:MAG: hypothetical protein WCK67_07200 [bacterium]
MEEKIYSSEEASVFINEMEITEEDLLLACPGIRVNPKTITITIKGSSEIHKMLLAAKQKSKVNLEVALKSGAGTWKMPFAFVYKLSPSKWGLRTFRNPLTGEVSKIENFEVTFTGTIYDSNEQK